MRNTDVGIMREFACKEITSPAISNMRGFKIDIFEFGRNQGFFVIIFIFKNFVDMTFVHPDIVDKCSDDRTIDHFL